MTKLSRISKSSKLSKIRMILTKEGFVHGPDGYTKLDRKNNILYRVHINKDASGYTISYGMKIPKTPNYVIIRSNNLGNIRVKDNEFSINEFTFKTKD